MKILLACLIVFVASAAEAQTMRRRDVTIAMVETLPETNIAILVHRPNEHPANVILLSRWAGPRELAAGMAVYRHFSNMSGDMRVVVKSTRGLNRTIDQQRRESLLNILSNVRGSEPRPLAGVASGSVPQLAYTYYVRR